MTPIFLTVGEKRPLIAVSDIKVVLDGHPILTYNYSIFSSAEGNDTAAYTQKNISEIDNTDPNYLGYITFEQPGRIFNYTPNDSHRLETDEVEELIEQLTHHRDTPSSWNLI